MLSEMLAVIEAMDPTAIPLWLTTAAAAAMYPLGLMLGSPCSPCCTPCGCPPGETLPDALVVSFSGLTKSAVKIDDLLSLQFSSCFGGGAAGTVQAPHGLPGTGGAITGVTLTSGGSGYAVLGRVEPTGLTISTSGGSGAEFSISLIESADDCGLPFWEISSVTVTKAGEGYSDNQQLSVSLGQDEFETLPANITLQTVPTEPTLTADVTVTEGTGLQLSVTTKVVSTNPNRWGVDKISVVDGGSGYGDNQPVVVTPGIGETTVLPASAIVRVNRVQPTVVPHYYGAGSGATFTPTLTKTTYNGDDVWEVTSVSVSGGGSGYVNNENVIFFSDTLGEINDLDSYWKIVTNGSGAVTSLTKTSGGRFWASGGVVTRVEVLDLGSYYGVSTSADAVTVLAGGRYYRERSDIAAHVASVTATISQTAPSAGSGATMSVTVDDDPESLTFGHVTAVSVDDGGDGYLEWSYTINDECCITNWNGATLILRKQISPCVYAAECCLLGSVSVTYNGVNTPPDVRINGACGLSFDVSPGQSPFSCENLSFTGTDIFGTGTVSVSVHPSNVGYEDEANQCPGCCSDTTKCNEQDCGQSDGARWYSPCSCKPCAGNVACDAVYLVTTEIYRISLGSGGAEIPGTRKTYEAELNSDNGWADGNTFINTFPNGFTGPVGFAASSPQCPTVNVFASTEWDGKGFLEVVSLTHSVAVPVAIRGDGLFCPTGGTFSSRIGGNLVVAIGRMETTVTVVT